MCMCVRCWQLAKAGAMSEMEAEWYGLVAYHYNNYLPSSEALRRAVVANNAGVIRATGHTNALDFDMAAQLFREASEV